MQLPRPQVAAPTTRRLTSITSNRDWPRSRQSVGDAGTQGERMTILADAQKGGLTRTPSSSKKTLLEAMLSGNQHYEDVLVRLASGVEVKAKMRLIAAS